jgi:hypothetical protein
VLVRGELRDEHVVLAGLFTRKPIGIAARHGARPVGPTHTVTRADGRVLFELDDRPALEVWLEDVRRAGATIPESDKKLTVYLANFIRARRLRLRSRRRRRGRARRSRPLFHRQGWLRHVVELDR